VFFESKARTRVPRLVHVCGTPSGEHQTIQSLGLFFSHSDHCLRTPNHLRSDCGLGLHQRRARRTQRRRRRRRRSRRRNHRSAIAKKKWKTRGISSPSPRRPRIANSCGKYLSCPSSKSNSSSRRTRAKYTCKKQTLCYKNNPRMVDKLLS